MSGVSEAQGEANQPSQREKAWVARALALVAGMVDAVGFLLLEHVFTAQMSGNSVQLGIHIGQDQLGRAFFRLFPVLMFVAGTVAGLLILELGVESDARWSLGAVLAAEAALLGLFLGVGVAADLVHHHTVVVGSRWQFYGLVALPSLSMGLQTATLRRVANHTVRTTYVTGMLTDMSEEVARLLVVWWRRPVKRRWRLDRHLVRSSVASRALFLGSIWSLYVIGALIGGLVESHLGLRALAVPIAALVALILVDLARPVPASRLFRT